ncbi:prepilin-type N-terminal cleavage/methylation domain-containing protein [Thermosynechococcus sp. HY591]|uniref:prepilin-type N-terminal cleavage/methylation domain-containing protein n=2 Tax=Thermosynechococcus TaxID=146785 RepID=UPI002672CF09|nr:MULTISPECIES: prepilin-type N-terminal cleavage/methylation domain-containing protein [unclassified Thermosynechococcus]WKT83249.1 prepilin-type N-terminal cleavage/methylation domain-containing protein [Thermosynechococcus sp. HY596]WNC62378.1 prepilin-type N-terminal cleavage/methylation domain-containing protein [Thermosynechococcus sp. HY591]
MVMTAQGNRGRDSVYLKLLFFLQERRRWGVNGGLTFPEVLVVIVILGVIALIALPSLLNQRLKAQLAGAKSAVGAVNRAQEAYRVRHKIFATKIAYLGLYNTQGGGYRVDGYYPLTLTYDQVKEENTGRILHGGGNPWYAAVHAQAIDPAGKGVSGCVWAKPGDFGVTSASVKEGTTAAPPGDCWEEQPEGSNDPVKYFPIQTTE